MSSKKKKSKKRIKVIYIYNWDEFNKPILPPLSVRDATIAEAMLLMLIILTVGFILVVNKNRDTSNSKIHCLFKPFDRIMTRTHRSPILTSEDILLILNKT